MNQELDNQQSPTNRKTSDRPNTSEALFSLLKKITITNIPKDQPLEQTNMFLLLVKYFNLTNNTKYQLVDVLSSGNIFLNFLVFVMGSVADKEIVFSKKNGAVLKQKINELREKYHQNEMEHWRDKIYQATYAQENVSRDDPLVAGEMHKFRSAYTDVERVFYGQMRKYPDQENKLLEEFSHMKGTMQILVEELLPNTESDALTKFEWNSLAIIALLHDLREYDSGYTTKHIEHRFGTYIAGGVGTLTKQKLKIDADVLAKKNSYSASAWKEIEGPAKIARDKKYFGKLDNLKFDLGYLLVKMADRIHNLRTLRTAPKSEVIRTVEQTEEYFLKSAIQARVPHAYKLIEYEVDFLRKAFDLPKKTKKDTK